MKQKLKALASLCLALALTLCLTLPAWAAGGDDAAGRSITDQTKGSIEVSGVESGVTVNVYRLMTVNVNNTAHQPQMPVYSWVKPVGDWLKKNTDTTYKGYISNVGNDYSVTENFKDKGETNAAEIAAFYDSLAAAIRGGTAISNFQPTGKATVAQNQTECTISGLPMGNYLVLIEGGMKIYRPSAVNLVPVWEPGEGDTGEWVVSKAIVDLKSSELTITKTVTDTADKDSEERKYAQVDIGDTVTYTLVADVPEFPADAINKGYQISDILPAGMTLNADSVKVFGGGENGQGTVIGENEYNLNSTDATRPEGVTEDADTKTVDFSITFKNIINIRESYSKIKITYTATANENIKVVGDSEGQYTNTTGNQNTAYLDYNNNPYEVPATGETLTWKTDYDTATVYTYGIKVTKTDDKDDSKLLAGAEFQVYKDEDKDGKINEGAKPLNFVAVGNNGGAYRFAASTETEGKSSTVAVGGENSSNKGNLTLSGLDVGTYILKETKAPDEYNLPSHTFSVTITDEQDVASGAQTPNGKPEYKKTNDDGTTIETDRADGYERTTITNTQGFTLPTTGGMGTVLFTAGGVVLMGAGLVLLVVFLRRRRAK